MNPDLIRPIAAKDIPIPEWFDRDEERRGYWRNKMRLLFFDPTEIYSRALPHIDPFKRTQSKLSLEILFPKRSDGICRCGCGKEVNKFWHSQTCSNFAYRVYEIMSYGTAGIKQLMNDYYGDKCQVEGCNEYWCDIDHVVPVKHGGGGCWLSNFLPLCKEHHKDKTNRDFKRGKYK